MKKEIYLSLAVAAAGMVSVSNAATRPEKPNVLFILIDDLGWQDVKCYDIDEPSPYETPNIDALSKESVKFWQAYSPAPSSSPSRGALLSGKHPARLHRTHVSGGQYMAPVHIYSAAVVAPWYSGRLPVSEVTIPELLKPEGYVSGHVGKWHVAAEHHCFPQPIDHGFDESSSTRGVTQSMRPDRLSAFATNDAKDPYRLDENGFPKDQLTLDAMAFMDKNKAKPFFMYYCTWLVHFPVQTRAKHLLEKYAKKMNVPVPTSPDPLNNPEGQNNPYYGAMVEMMDYYVGQLITYLKTTDDPRWSGHKLIDNTYVIFSSDNGGAEGHKDENFTDNYPLDKGKTNVQEGGTRVPFMICGPNIPQGVESNVVINGLDLLPTIASWAGAKIPSDLVLDGVDLSTMLEKDPTNASLVKNSKGQVRDYVLHHFPHTGKMNSSLRQGGYKLIHKYSPDAPESFELYQLYDKNNKRVDIEEKKDLAKKMPEKVASMKKILLSELKDMDASYPYLNPNFRDYKDQKPNFPVFTAKGNDGNKVWATYKQNKNKIVEAFIQYKGTMPGGENEWHQMPAKIVSEGRVEVTVPEGTTNYIIGLVDNKRFYHDYPTMGAAGKKTPPKHPKGFEITK